MLEQIIGDYPKFLDAVLQKVESSGFDMDDFIQLDHVCYRTISLKNYLAKRNELQQVAMLLGENTVNGRPIATFRFNEPIQHKQWRIDAIELPAPKAGSKYKEGLEHIEFVIFDDLKAFLDKYKDKPFEMRAANRGVNPEISLQLEEHSVKFHLLNLPAVIYIEDKLGIDNVKDGQ